MHHDPHSLATHPPKFRDLAPHRVAEVIKAHLESGNHAYALAYLSAATRTIASADPTDIHLLDIHVEPVAMPNATWDTFFRAMFKEALPGRKPIWTAVEALPEPTYIIERDSNHLRANIGTPPWLRSLNILVDEENLRLL